MQSNLTITAAQYALYQAIPSEDDLNAAVIADQRAGIAHGEAVRAYRAGGEDRRDATFAAYKAAGAAAQEIAERRKAAMRELRATGVTSYDISVAIKDGTLTIEGQEAEGDEPSTTTQEDDMETPDAAILEATMAARTRCVVHARHTINAILALTHDMGMYRALEASYLTTLDRYAKGDATRQDVIDATEAAAAMVIGSMGSDRETDVLLRALADEGLRRCAFVGTSGAPDNRIAQELPLVPGSWTPISIGLAAALDESVPGLQDEVLQQLGAWALA